MSISDSYFDQIRQMWQGADDNFKGNYIEYFKNCNASEINPVPLLFKSLQSNTLYFKGMRVSFEQAIAIRRILEENAKLEKETTPKDNPFLIKTLVIDDCGMTDKVFEQILIGIVAQSHIKNLHYVNRNILGPRSALLITELCSRMKNPIYELNLSSIKIESPISNKEPSLLIQIT